MDTPVPPINIETLLANVDGMRRLAHRLVRDPALAEDVAQDAVLVALSKEPQHRRNLRGWLNGIVRNIARDAHRKASRRGRHEGAAPAATPEPEPATHVARLAEQRRLLEAVETLPEPYRRTVWQRYFEDHPPRVIARQAMIPVATVHTRLRRARTMLRAELDQAHGGDRRAWALALAPLTDPGTSWALSSLIGGALVTIKTKISLLGLLVLLAAGGMWWITRSDPSLSGPESDPGPACLQVDGGDPSGGGVALKARGMTAAAKERPPDPNTIRIMGKTLDEADRALANVEIRVGPLGVEDVESLAVVSRTTTEGRFAFSAPEGETDLRLVARAAGRLDAVARIRRAENTPLSLRLPAVPTYVFRVLDGETDGPLAGVVCETRRKRQGLMWTATRRSDENGILRLPNPMPDQMDTYLGVRMIHPGYRPLLRVKRPNVAKGRGTPARPRDLYLFRAPRLVLEARDSTGRPVPGARVQAWAGSPSPSSNAPEWRMSTFRHWDDGSGKGVTLGDALTDEEGRVIFSAGPKSLGWHAYAVGDGQAGFAQGSSRYRGESGPVVIDMHLSVRIVGRVTDGDGQPVARARVEVTPWFVRKQMLERRQSQIPIAEIMRRCRTMTDADGQYILEDLPLPPPPAELFVQTHRGDLGFASGRVPPPEGPDRTCRLDLAIERKHDVQALRVVDAEDHPIAGALVTHANMLPGMLTDAAGLARLVLYPGMTGEFRAFKRGYLIGRTDPSAGGEEARIVLEKASSLRGRVLDKDGRPHSAHVEVYSPETAEVPEGERGQILAGNRYGRARAGDSGYFHVTDLPEGPYFVRYSFATRRDGKRHSVSGEQVVEGPGPVELRLPESEPPMEATGAVEGSVVDADGKVLTDHWLSLQRPSRSIAPILNGRRFRFEDVPPGEWNLKASTEQGAKRTRVSVLVRPGDTSEVRVIMGRSLSIRGRLVDESGKGLAGTYVLLFREGDRSWSGPRRTGSDGRFEVKNLLAGRYRARIRWHGTGGSYYTSDEFTELRADQEDEIVIWAKPAGTVTLELDDEGFLEHTKEWYRMSNTEKGQRSWFSRVVVVTATGEKLTDVGLFHGRKTFSYPLGPGSYELSVTSMNEGSFRTTFVINAREDTLIPVVLEK